MRAVPAAGERRRRAITLVALAAQDEGVERQLYFVQNAERNVVLSVFDKEVEHLEVRKWRKRDRPLRRQRHDLRVTQEE